MKNPNNPANNDEKGKNAFTKCGVLCGLETIGFFGGADVGITIAGDNTAACCIGGWAGVGIVTLTALMTYGIYKTVKTCNEKKNELPSNPTETTPLMTGPVNYTMQV